MVVGGLHVDEPVGGVDEELVAEDHGVVDQVVPAQLRLHLVVVQQHVGVEPVQDVALGVLRAQGAGVRAAPGLRGAQHVGVLGPQLGQHQRRVAAVVDHHDLEQVGGVGLRGETGQAVGQGRLGVVRRDHHGHGQAWLPGADHRRLERAPLVPPDPGLLGLPAHLGDSSRVVRAGRSVGSSSSRGLGLKPRHCCQDRPRLTK